MSKAYIYGVLIIHGGEHNTHSIVRTSALEKTQCIALYCTTDVLFEIVCLHSYVLHTARVLPLPKLMYRLNNIGGAYSCDKGYPHDS